MSITEKKKSLRVWSKRFLSTYSSMSIEDRYLNLVLGLSESGFIKRDYLSPSPLSRVTDMVLEGVLVRLYLVELDEDSVICYRVGLEGSLEDEETETIFKLGSDMIWEDIRRVWKNSK